MEKNTIKFSLVDYSSDEEQCVSEENLDKKNINSGLISKGIKLESDDNGSEKLPLPSEIKLMFDHDAAKVGDEPEKHGGKIRSFPHERGVWATYIYIQYKAEPEFSEMVDQLKKVSESHGITLSSIENFHVSLSKTLKLRHHWIEPFVDSLRAKLRHFYRFKLMFQSLEVYENEEKTRTFIGLKVHFGIDYLCQITEKIDSCLSEFKLPLFYKNPSFHLSCAACVGNKVEQIELFMADLNAIFQSFTESHSASRTLFVTDICCKSGNKLFKFALK